MIDIWMLFTMTIPFLEVVLHTLHEVFKRPSTFHIVPEPRVDVLKVQSEEEEVAKKNNSMKMTKVTSAMGSLMLPICSLVFTITFWAVGIIKSYSSADVQDSNMSDCLTIDPV